MALLHNCPDAHRVPEKFCSFLQDFIFDLLATPHQV